MQNEWAEEHLNQSNLPNWQPAQSTVPANNMQNIDGFSDGWKSEEEASLPAATASLSIDTALTPSLALNSVSYDVDAGEIGIKGGNQTRQQSNVQRLANGIQEDSNNGDGLGLVAQDEAALSNPDGTVGGGGGGVAFVPPSSASIDIPSAGTRGLHSPARSQDILSVAKSNDSLRRNSTSSSPRKSVDAKQAGTSPSYPQRDSKSPIFSPFGRKKSGPSTTSTSARGGGSNSVQPVNGYTPTLTKSQTISQMQSVFNDSQKIAYVGLCYLSIYIHRKKRLENAKNAVSSFDKWSKTIMEKLYIYLDLLPAERTMIENLAAHGLVPADLSTSLIQDAKKAAQEFEDSIQQQHYQEQAGPPASPQQPPMDIRYTILSHLFLLAIADGFYDARARTMIRTLAQNLDISYEEVVRLENCIANELRVYEDESTVVRHDEAAVGERNTKEGKGRWIYAGLGVLAGGALIGVTAGLAAPFIGAGIGAALTTFGVSQGAVVGGFMASTGGIALITGGGVLTGGGMSGKAMINRTRGIEEFEFLSIEEAMLKIKINREQRRLKRLKTIKNDAQIKEMELQKELNAHLHSDSNLRSAPVSARVSAAPSSGQSNNEPGDLLWEAKSNFNSPDLLDEGNGPSLGNDAEKTLDIWADKGGNDDDDVVPPVESPNPAHPIAHDDTLHQTHVLITVSGWVTYDQDDHTFPFSTLETGMNGDQYTLIWDTNALKELGSTMLILASEIASFIIQQGLQATILPVLMGALTGPMWLIKLTYLVDNPWGNALSKAEKAGRLLADTLIGQVQNGRPVTLVGYSIGARLIFYCLLELAAQGAYGIIESVYICGTPCVASKKEWEAVMSVVSGKVYNFYNPSDTLLAVIYRTSIASFKDVPGLSPVEGIEGVENKDVSEIVNGHMEYSIKMPSILKDFGFYITSEKIMDQEAENEAWKEEMEEEKKKSKEKKEKERLVQIEKLAQDKQAEEDRRKSAALVEQERKRLAKEAAVALKKRKEAEERMKEIALNRTGPISNFAPPSMSLEEIAHEELREMAEMEKMMMQYWEPREITSTLPPLVIDPSLVAAEKVGDCPGSATGTVATTSEALFANPDEDHSPRAASVPPEEELSDF